MRVLFIAPRLPCPADTGAKIRTLNIIRQVLEFATVDLICLSFDDNDKIYAKELARLGIEVHLVAAQEPPTAQKVKSVLLDKDPYSVNKYYLKEMEDQIIILRNSYQYDVIHFDHIHMTHYRDCLDGLPCIVDEHNVEYKILERCSGVEKNIAKKIVYGWQAKKMAKFEARMLRQFSYGLAVSEDDRQLLENLTYNTVKTGVIANGVDTDYFRSTSEVKATGLEIKKEEALIFTGSMDWLPNEDAVLYFSQYVLPLIWKQNKDVKFFIVGKGPSVAVQALGKTDGRIIITGRVDDVRPYMERAKIFVVPIRIGGGTRLKILEAMSMQMPVVSTCVGAEGIDYTHSLDIIISDDPQEMADKIVALLTDEPGRVTLGEKARQLVCGQYDWRIIGERLKKIYKEITNV